MIRLNKYMSEAGICSRREADRLIGQGRVTVDGTMASVGMQIEENQKVALDGRPVGQDKKHDRVIIAVNKPRGVVCSNVSQRDEVNIIDFLKFPEKIMYAGRLDKESEGLLLMTNDGDMINQMMRAANYHEKEYEVTLDRPFNERFLKDMAAGVYLKELDETTRPCVAERLGKRTFRIILTQGLNRQIRRMCKELGFHVQKLKRVRIMNICLGHLKTGTWRNLSEREVTELLRLLENDAETETELNQRSPEQCPDC
ncbi:MAG TPA: 23S rRNA pseudouridine synthase F [Lachnospiraceae bacterium]|nr:23S rRNA pseudouridine synthase F [Lachnospiraceae bacterium]